MKLIIIEDDVNIIKPIKKYLKGTGFVLDKALTGQDGLKMIETENYDLLILDLNLPDLSGERICKIIRAKKINLPILILSAENQVNTKVNLLNTGADDYLSKPFSLPELFSRIKALLRRPKIILNQVVKIGNFELNRYEKKLKIAKKEIYLTRKEFLILELLANHQGVVVSKNEIMEQVWDNQVNLFSKTIEMHMTNLRKKISSKTNKCLIKTVPGRGYKFN